MSNNVNNTLSVKVSASLDRAKTLTQINADIKAIEGQLKFLKLQAGLDKGKTNAEIQKQISELNAQKRQLNVDLKLRQKDLKKQYRDAVAQIQTNPIDIEVTSTTAQNNIKSLSNEVNRTTSETVSLASALTKAFSNMGLVISSQTALQLVRKAASEATEAIKEYDKYATNLSVITGGSRSDSDKIISDLAEKSLEFKVDISDLESAEETLLRTGKTIDETNKYLENTVYLSKLGFQGMDESASQLVTIGNAYEYTADEMANVVDKFVKLDSKANVTAGALAEGVAKSAQNAKLAGFNIDQLSASIAALKDTTGSTETQVANSLNMIFSRLQNVKLGKFVIESEDGTEDITEALNDTEKLLNVFNIKLRDSKNEFRDIGELFTELSEKWENFNSVQQSAIATTIAGARQRNTFIALIENWNKVQELTDVSLNSAGTAVQKYESYLQGVEAKTAELNTSMKELWTNLLPNELMGNLLEAGTAVVQFTDKYRILQTALKSAVIWGLANGIAEIKNGLPGVIGSLNNITNAMDLASKVVAVNGGYYNDLVASLKGMSDTQLKLVLGTVKLSDAEKIQMLQLNGLSEAEAKAKFQTLGLAQANKTAATATFNLGGAFKSLAAIIKANPVMSAAMAITAVWTIIENSQRKQAEANQAVIDSAVESANKYKEQAKSLDDLKTAYINIVDSETTATEKTEALNDWKNELIKTYGFERQAIENVNLEREKGLGLLDKEIEKQNRKNADLWMGENAEAFEEARKAIQEYTVRGVTYSSGNTVFERKANVEREIAKLGAKNKLNVTEEIKLKNLNTTLAELNKTIDKYGEVYTTGYNFKATQVFDDYINSAGNLENVGKESYSEWKNGLISAADGDRELKKKLEEKAAEQFPDYEKILQDRSNVKIKLKDAQIIGDIADNFINSLSDEDLDILANKIEKPFEKGIDGAKALIEGFKSSPEYNIDVNTDTKSFEELKGNYDDLSKSADTFVKNLKTVKSAFEELDKHGQLSADTIKSLTDAGYASALMYDETTGAVTLNTAELDRLNAQKRDELKLDFLKQKTDLAEKYKEEEKSISDLRAEYEALGKVSVVANQARLNEITLELAKHGATANEILDMINQYEGFINSLNAPTFDNDKKDKPQQVLDYEEWVAKAEHEIAMGQRAEDKAYYDEKISRARVAYDNLEDYQSDLWKAEEEYYKWCNDQDQELFEKRIDNYEKLADKALDKNIDGDGKELSVTASFDYARSEINTAIDETQKRINELSEKTGFEDEVKSLLKDLEDLNDKLDEIDKKEIESEKDYIEELKDSYSDMMDDRIDSIKEESEAVEKIFDKQIDIIDKQSDAYDKQIDAIEKVNDAEKRKTDILEAQKEVKEAELELEKAHVKNRLVFTGGSHWEAREDKDAVKEAEEKLAEAKAELEEKKQEEQKAILEEQKSALEDQKKLLQEAKDNADEYYSDITNTLEQQQKTGEKTYDALINVLDNVDGKTKQKSSNSELYNKLTETGDLDKIIDNLSATEYKKAIESGILKVDDKGNYSVDYSAIENYNEAVESNSDVTKENTETVASLVDLMKKFLPENADSTNVEITDKANTVDSKKVVPVTYSEWQKKHKISEYAPKGKDVPDMTFEEYLSGKELKTETIKSDIKHYGANGQISNSDLDKYFKEAGLDKFIKQIIEGTTGLVPTANEIFGQQMQMIVGGQNIRKGDVVNNAMNMNGKPQFNCTINVEGSADEKTVEKIRTEMDNAFCEYTAAMTSIVNTEVMKRKYKA